MSDLPDFVGRKELARYIAPIERAEKNRASYTAFTLSGDDKKTPKTAHLSVNSLEVESASQIAEYFRTILQDGSGDVTLYTNKVQNFVTFGRSRGGVAIRNVRTTERWVFDDKHGEAPAFKHREVSPVEDTGRPGSPSHCGVEFLRVMEELKELAFARELAKSPKYHTYSEG